ncbi:MAG: adenosylcobinamide-GDP ribazoletransferase [Magnetococcus sp. YQC-5]
MTLRPWRIALGLLTRIPVNWRGPPPTPVEIGVSVLFYPLVGLLLGQVLVLFTRILPEMIEPGVRAALILLAWVWLTGGLHLDGLADTADAWIGGMGDRERTLAIMKDPHCGPAAVTAVVLLLIIKWSTLQSFLNEHPPDVLFIPLFLGRVTILALFLQLPYVRTNGMGAVASKMVPYDIGLEIFLSCFLFVIIFWNFLGIQLLLVWIVVWYIIYYALIRRLGGITGDTVGAACEITEATLLISLNFF